MSSFLNILEATYRLTVGSHGGSQSPFETCYIFIYFRAIKAFVLAFVKISA